MRSILPADCGRARQQMSLRVDSELSEFEGILLDAHLSRCEDCRAFARGLAGLTETLRTVPVEEPSISFRPPRRRARVEIVLAGSLRAGSAAAAVAVFAIAGLIALNGSTQGASSAELVRARAVLNLHERQLRRLDAFGEAAGVPRGVSSAERTALRVAKSSRRLQGRR